MRRAMKPDTHNSPCTVYGNNSKVTHALFSGI